MVNASSPLRAFACGCAPPDSGQAFFALLDRLDDHLLGVGRVMPAVDLDPFAGLEILVVLEEMRDLVERDLRQVGVVRRPSRSAWSAAATAPRSIFSSSPALSSITSTPIGRTLMTQPGTSARVLQTSTSIGSPSPDKRVRHEAVIAGIAHRGVQEAVDEQRAGRLVHLVFDRLAADRHLDDDVDVFRRILADRDRFDAHGG